MHHHHNHSHTTIQSLVGIVYGWDYDGIWSSSIPQLSFLIYENIFVECFRSRLSFPGHWISPLSGKYLPPPLFLFFVCLTASVSPPCPRSHQGQPLKAYFSVLVPIACPCVSPLTLFLTTTTQPKHTKCPISHLVPLKKPFPQSQPPQISCPLPCAPNWHASYTPLLSYANISIILYYLPLSSYFVQSIPSSSSLSSIQAQSPNWTTCHAPVCVSLTTPLKKEPWKRITTHKHTTTI